MVRTCTRRPVLVALALLACLLGSLLLLAPAPVQAATACLVIRLRCLILAPLKSDWYEPHFLTSHLPLKTNPAVS